MRVSDADHWTSPSLQALVPSGDGESGFLTRMGIDGELIEVMSSDSWLQPLGLQEKRQIEIEYAGNLFQIAHGWRGPPALPVVD